ncbi:MAG: inositol monophosphatase family protein [Legionellaceae bacterium]|nr:inositol monophosphatase family protein [Legionellaceae bacterium]
MHPLLNIAINAARLAGDIIQRNSDQLDRIKIMQKNQGDFYSEVDVKAEQAIINTILKAYPDHGINAEESGNYQEDSDYIWIIDPLDGTKNYLHSFPFYAVSIALSYKNRIEHAVVYDPIRHECFSSSRGSGTKLNDRRIRVSKTTKFNQAMLSSGIPVRSETLSERYLNAFQSFTENCGGMRSTGSAALDLAYLAAGRIDGVYALSMQPWDIAAGVLLVQEAGGLISDHSGREDHMKSGDVIAGSPKIFKQMLQALK